MIATSQPSQPIHRSAPGRLLPLLLVLFLGSGCAALIYEIVWLQLLQLTIGLTNVSLGLLLGVFMGGMGLGSLWLPRWISTRHHPLRVYALLELGLAGIGVALLFIVPVVSDFYTAHAGSGLGGLLRRGSLAALCLLPPTVLMGATLPIIARWLEETREGVAWLGFFYGGNIAGAVLGCVLAGFYLLRLHDMATATYVAATINVALAALAFVLSKTSPGPAVSPATTSAPRSAGTTRAASTTNAVGQVAQEAPVSTSTIDAREPVSNDRRPSSAHVSGRLVYLTIALSGLTALGAEVVWTRVLSLLMGGTVYTFSIILAVFLIGLGLGSGAGSLVARVIVHPRRALAGCQFLLVMAIAWAAVMMARSLPYWPINPALSPDPWFTFQLDVARGLWVVLPSAILWGASFPLALTALADHGRDPARLVGGVYAANTAGAILGALLFSLLIVPLAGTLVAQRILIGLAAVSALVALGFPRERPVEMLKFAAAAVLVVITAVVSLGVVTPVPWGVAAYGRYMLTYRNRLFPGIVPAGELPKREGYPDLYCNYVGEGLNGTIAVTRWASGVRNFHSAGKVQASSEPRDMRLQRMLGHLSALAHAKPESVLVVACGAGVTAGTFVTHPELKRLVICDIEPLVPRIVAPMFARENFDVINDRRTQIISDDGRHFIRTTPEKFDIITSDPIDPWVKGCAALNTVEYYEMCKARLKPGGVMSLWIPLYESNPEAVKSLIATFFQVFPHGVLWSNDDENDEGYDAVLFAQVEPTQIDLDQLQTRLERPDHARVKQSMEAVGFPSAVDLIATYAGQASDLQEWMKGAQINTDRNLRLQYLAGWANNSFRGAEILEGIRRHHRFPENVVTGSPDQKARLKARLRKVAAIGGPAADPFILAAPKRNGVDGTH